MSTAELGTAQQTERAKILAEINELESRLIGLRAVLPPSFKVFYVFRTNKRQTWVYASNIEEATRKLHERMNRDYGPEGWERTSKVVDQYTDPQSASANSPGNLCSSLSRADALEFIRDWKDNQRGKPER